MERSDAGADAQDRGRPVEADDADIAQLLTPCSADVRELFTQVRAFVREVVPDAGEEVDLAAKMLGLTYRPGTYQGLILAISLQKAYVNVIFSKGVELMELDPSHLLEGTGKLARHIKFRGPDRIGHPDVRVLLEAAAARTPR